MAKKKSPEKESRTTRPDKKSSGNPIRRLTDQTLQGVLAVAAFVLAIFTLLAIWDKAGVVGHYTFSGLKFLLGVGYYLLPVIFIAFGISSLFSLQRRFDSLKIIGFALFLLAALAIIDILSAGNGGFLGKWIAYPFVMLFDVSASIIFLSAILVVSILIAFNEELDLRSLFSKKEDDEEEEEPEEKPLKLNLGFDNEDEKPIEKKKKEKKPEPEEEEEEEPKEEKRAPLKVAMGVGSGDDEVKEFMKPANMRRLVREYVAPPLALLERDKGKPVVGDVKANANIIKRTLANFGIDVEMDEVSIGPSVTRYALKPAEGVKLSRIVGLQNDLALALAAHPLRIEAPIPGKSLVGIEIPNTTKTTVGLGTLFSADEFQGSDKPLLVALGKGISGKSHFANTAKMPHLLIAGATGSGKSVTIHALIVSLLYRNSPEMLKFIMIDPKRVELTLYNKIPHLLTPVITEARKAILSLKWAAKEMDRRYDVLQGNGVRDIDSYHKTIYEPWLEKAKTRVPREGDEPGPEPLPYIVIVIDELADIMQTYPRELEAGIVRL
ncbi:MAG: DNA translocase FtsK 4TM domain-containing protein, partial [Candidatus Paceibacterota bacterium]